MRRDQVFIREPFRLTLAVIAFVTILLAVPLLIRFWTPIVIAESGKPDVIPGRPIAPSLLHALKNG